MRDVQPLMQAIFDAAKASPVEFQPLLRVEFVRLRAATRLTRKPAVQHPRQPALRITVGKAIVVGCLNFQLQPERQFAMYR